MVKIFRPQRLNNGGTPKFRALKTLRARARFQHSGSRRSCTV